SSGFDAGKLSLLCSIREIDSGFCHRRLARSMTGEPNDYPTRPAAERLLRGSLRPVEGTPPPPRRSRQSRNQVVTFLNFLLSSLVFIVLVAGIIFYVGSREFTRPGPSTT